MKSENIITMNSEQHDITNSSARDVNARIIRECKKVVDQDLIALVNKMFENVDDFLFDLAEKCDTNQKQALYFDAMRVIRLRREKIEKSYRHRIDASFNQALTLPMSDKKSSSSTSGTAFSDELSLDLIDQEELEESLAITNMVSKISSHLNRDLYALAQRFNAIYSTDRFSEKDQPLSIENVCFAFRDALASLEDDASIEIKLIIYKLFDRFVLSELPPLYERINNIFIHSGILPTIKSTILKPRNTQPVQSTLSNEFANESVDQQITDESIETPTTQTLPLNTATIDVPQDTYLQLRNLLPNHLNHEQTLNHAATIDDEIQAEDVNNIIAKLTQLQQTTNIQLNGKPNLHSTVSLKDSLNIAESESQGHANSDYCDTIDIIGMLFEFILDDDNLNSEMKALLARLQIPILKVTVLDKSFISQNTHPARRLLNELAHACVGWEASEDLENDMMYQGVANIVQRVLTEFDDKVEIFDTFLLEFQQLCENYKEQEAALQHKIEEIKNNVIEAIEKRITNTEVPEPLKVFITTRWAEVLTATGERFTTDSAQWKSALSVIDNLLWSIQPKVDQTERKLLLMMIPQMLEEIEAGLELIGVEKTEYKNFNTILEQLHIESMRPVIPEHVKQSLMDQADESNQSEATEDDEIVLETVKDETLEEDLDLSDALNTVRSLELGTWVEFSRPNMATVRGKLVWKDDYFDSYTFANRRFKVVVDDSKTGIAKLFHHGHAHLIDDLPLLDRAIDAITVKLAKLSTS